MPYFNRRDFLKTAGFTASAPFISCRNDRAVSERPNIVFILADDMGYGDLSCENPDSKIPTPNLDRLANEGMRFSDAHSPSAVCTPTRYGILTGRYCWRSRLKKDVLWCWDRPLIERDRPTVAALLKSAGYDTACIGKWHLGWDWPTTDGRPPVGMGKTDNEDSGKNVDFSRPLGDGPTSRGFDYYFGTAVPNFPPYCFIENERTAGIPRNRKPPGMFGAPGPMIGGWKLENILPALMNKAVEYIDAKGGKGAPSPFRQTAGNPFFLFLPLTAPHTTIATADEFLGSSDAGRYGDFVHQVDHVAGEVLKALDRNGFRDNTLVIFTSDNGSPARDGENMSGAVRSVLKYGHNPSHIYRGIKTDIWDGGHRVPFIVRWPGRVPAGIVSDETVCLVDFMATVGAILDRPIPENAGEDSYNILPVLLGERLDAPIREATVHHSIDGTFAIRRGKWKLILGKGSGGWSDEDGENDPPGQLYDMARDESERTNLYDAYPDIVQNLRELLKRYEREGRSAPVRKS